MNPYLETLNQYPFERLNHLKNGLVTRSKEQHISLALGEPKHSPPNFLLENLTDNEIVKKGLMSYPTTKGSQELRNAISLWLKFRFGADVSPDHQILPASGTREALFSFGQAILSGNSDSYVVLPNPFYQIYEGATLLRGALPYYVDSNAVPEFDDVEESIWAKCELVYICSPGNPSGRAIPKEVLKNLIELSQKHKFVIAADECYSELYYNENHPPVGLLEVATEMGLHEFDNCVVFHSLSKRSNCPGLRSGFIAGDAKILSKYYDYRTYEGCAVPLHVQHVSAMAWSDENHVIQNRAAYREKFEVTKPILKRIFDVSTPDGGFYYWPDIDRDDVSFAKELFINENITVLPGQYLGRNFKGDNPGKNHIRIALVAEKEECVSAIERLVNFVQQKA